jgi:proline iminopeptidase
MTTMRIRDVSLLVEVVGHGPPLLLMHGGPGGDHWTLLPFRRLADRFTLVFYDHRCNGRSTGAPVTSMTWDNLTADADALREKLGFEKWAVLGHSFGGNVALEYALRYPDSLSQLILLDTGGEGRWSLESASQVLAKWGFSPRTVRLARRWLNGQVPPRQFMLTLLRLGDAYNPTPASGSSCAGCSTGSGAPRPAPRRLRLPRGTCSPAGRSWIASARSRCRRW